MSMGYDTDILQLMDNIMHCLPHGSGIDYTWTVRHIILIGDELEIVFDNEYHSMDEMGGYCCIIPFRVFVDAFLSGDGFSISNWYVCVDITADEPEFKHINRQHLDMEEYLADTIHNHLVEGLKELGYKFKS